MSKRISPAEWLRVEIDEVFAGGEDLSRAIERVAQLGAQLLLQSALEAEVAAFLGRERYERAAASEDPRAGMRNGYCPTTVKTTAGPITLARPKLRNTTERFASRLFGKGVTKTNALESLVIAGRPVTIGAAFAIEVSALMGLPARGVRLRAAAASAGGQPGQGVGAALVAAIVDRVTFNAHIIETGTQSYRLRTSKPTTRRKRAS